MSLYRHWPSGLPWLLRLVSGCRFSSFAHGVIFAVALYAAPGLAANPLRADDNSATDRKIEPETPAEPPALMARVFAGNEAAAPRETAESPPSPAENLKLPPGHPTRVEVDLEIVEISQIQDHDQKFDVEFNAYFLWHDPRLAFDEQATGEKKRVLPADDIWTPDPLLVDELDVDARGGETVHIHPDGMVHLNRYYRGSVAGSFDLHEFPLDQHDLEVALEARGYESDEVTFVVGEVKTENPQRAVPHGWKLLSLSSSTSETTYARLNETYSLLRVNVQVARDPHFYFWSIILPLIPIVATAWSVFWMDPKEFSSQVGVGITAMLTVVAYRITIDSSLPPLTYMTRMDYFLLVCQTFVFIAFVATVVIHVLYALDVPHMRARAASVTETCRWLPPVALVLICAALALLPVRYGTFVILAPVVAAAVWMRGPLLRLSQSIMAIVRPETLLAQPAAESSQPHARFRSGERATDAFAHDRRKA